MKHTSRTMVDLLRRHYLPEGRPAAGVFATEIQSPDGKRRADLIWLPVTMAAHGHGLVGHEIKVSRADVLAELADPLKHDAWIQYCTAWWLVVSDPALVDGLDVPEAWGIMSPPSGRRTRTMTVIRKAPVLKARDLPGGYRQVAVWQHWQQDDLRIQLAMARADADRWRSGHREMQTEVDRLRGELRKAGVGEAIHLSATEQAVRDIVAKIGDDQHDGRRLGHWREPIEIDDVVTALQDLGKLRGIAQEVERTLESNRRSIGWAIESLQRALKGEPT